MTQQEFQTRYKYNPSTDCIGEGGFGKVYKAYDTHLDKRVAIKVAEVKPGLEQVRLKKEVEIVSKLPTHPNIANYQACYTFSSFTGEYDFAVLQYYEEGNLQQLIDSGKLNQTQKETILRQILEGIGFLHNQDIIHRDLKPQNILIAKRNDEYIPKITDFGISKKLDINKSSVFTNSLAGAGTMAYASPEQLLGKTIKKNTDLWSFGVIAFQLLTGKMPFNTGKETLTSEAGRQELYKQITSGVISDNLSLISESWKDIISQCLVVDNEQRIQNVSKIRNSTENETKLETNIFVHNTTIENKTKHVENNKTTVIENTQPPKSSNNQSNGNSNFKVIISLIAVIILVVVAFVYFNQSSNNVTDNLQPPNEDSIAVETVAIVDTVVVDTTAIFNSNSAIKEIVYSSMTDIDGNVYKTVKIGNQIWMAENLRVENYRNGDPIENIYDYQEWIKTNNGAFCFYNNDVTYSAAYGKLYNWFAVSDSRGLAPKGWHIPSDEEWSILINYLGGDDMAGAKLKESGTIYWNSIFNGKDTNKGVTNSSGFSARPGGYRFSDAEYFASLGDKGNWWSSTSSDKENAWSRRMHSDYIDVSRNKYAKRGGFSVRCIKD